MPPSMRAQTMTHKRRIAERKQERSRREKLLLCIQEGDSALKASRKTGVSRTTATRIKKAYDTSNKNELEKLLNPEKHFSGPKPVISPFEEKLIVERVIQAAEQGFAVDNSTVMSVHARIAADRSRTYATGVPSADTIRAFRARNRSLAYRVAENVSNARLSAQTHEHFATLERELRKIEAEDPSLFLDPRRIWNWDETAVSGEYGRKTRCYASSTSNSGGARRSVRDPGKHVTAGLAVAACGNIAPLFLIASGKRVVNAWKKPLDKNDFSNSEGVPHWLCGEGWFPKEAALHVTKCGSVDREIIVKIVHHINSHVRKTLSPSLSILLLVDGHSSRNGLEWLDACERMNIIVVRLPANTTHILQPCDRYVNRRFQQTVRKTRDDLLSMCHLSWANTAYKIKLAVAGYESITAEDARKSFVSCGLWPMDYRFLQFVTSSHAASSSTEVSNNHKTRSTDAISQRPTVGDERRQSIILQNHIHKLTDGSVPASRALAEVSSVLEANYRVQKILKTHISPPKMSMMTRKAQKMEVACKKQLS